MKFLNKRIISLLLALVMICGMMPMTAFAAEETETNPWSSRSAVFVGDSITAGSGTAKIYYSFLEEALGFDSVTAMGVGGSCISAASDYGTGNQPLINRYQNIPSTDLIVIFMGTNDYGHETPLGNVGDTQDGTFYGALNVIIPALVAKHPSSKLVFVTPLHRYGFGTSKILGTSFTSDDVANGVGATLGDYVDALKTVCANNGVSVIDLYTECTLDPSGAEVRAAYMPDGLHPNAAGHEVIAGIMESHIRGYEPVEGEPIVQTELIHGNKFAAGNNQSCRASSRLNYYLKAGTVITLNNPDVMQWACAKTSDENSSSNLGYFPDSGWSDKETAVVTADGWVGFTFKYRDETQSFDLTKPLSDYITIEEPHTHTYVNGICTGCGATVSPYLQQLPENIIGCTNLYDSLVPVKGYYTAAKYDTSNGAVLSVVIPVEPGDRIAASSFGPVSENMGSVNGIRVTYLLGNEIVSSLSPGDVYSGYMANGYITVPDGVDAVCVPWWKPSDSNWLTLSQSSKDFAVHSPKPVSAQAPTCTEKGYTAGEICEVCNASLGEREEIPATGHSYSGDTCTICGSVNLLAILDGKYVSILGDSISTFNGYSNNAAANTTIGGNGPRYDAGTADTKPGSYCLLESVDDTWWMHFANRSGMKLLVNNSWAGSQVFGGQTSDGRVIPTAYLDRCVNLHDNTPENNPDNTPINPDVIFVYLGINDYNFNRSKVGTGAVDYGGLVNSDGAYVTPETFGEAYGIMLCKMRNAYPDAQIFAMTLLPENLYSVDKTAWEQHNTYIRGAAEYYGIPVVDLAENCAITWENYSGYMIDKIHPTTAGMKLISDCIETELVAYYKENQPHTHTYKAAVTVPTCTEQGYTTYTCECGDSYVADLLDATGHTYENGICTGCGVNEWDTDGDGVLEILAIGNSFSVDAMESVYQIAESLGIENIVLGNLYKGSCTLATHAKNAKNNTAAYAWFYNDNGTWSRDTNTWKDATEKTMGDALQERTWDFVSLQQASGSSGQPDTYNADLDYLIQYVSDNAPGAKLVWHMTWAYQQNTTHSAFPTYGKNQMTMYNAIVSAVQSKIVTNGNFDLIVPNGTAVQNSRTSLLGDTTTIDGYHMSRPYGRYLTSLMFVKAITGMDISDISYMPSGVSAEEKQIAIESVNNAYKTHFAVTESAYQKETVVIPEGYVQQNLDLTALGYWNSSDKNGDHNKIITTADNSKQYYATVQFTREQLPVDSVILLADGWQYRPEGWIKDAVNTNRPVTTTEHYVVITEEWWSNYTLRAFNISKAGLSSLSGVTEADICEAFQIYVPTRAHIHTYTPDVTAPTCTEQGYTTYTCACDDSYVSDYVDATGEHTYENGVCTGCGATQPGPVITQQPESVQQEIGKKFAVTVKAEGEDLTYQWYVKEAGAKAFKLSVNKTASYAYTMQSYMHNRQVYCVITDANGDSVQTETATITRPPVDLTIIEQPKDAQANIGEKFSISPKVEGEGLAYQWYVKESGAKAFKVSSIKGSAYALAMQKYMIGRQVYCVITDQYGNSVTTDVATISLPPVELKILEQPADVYASKGEKFSVSPKVQGDGLTYQWYYKEGYMKDFKPSSNKTSAYAYSMQTYMNNRQVYCVITDKYGNQVVTEVVTIHLEK